MAPQQPGGLDDFGWANPALRQQLRTDPAAALKDRGIEVPADLPLLIVHQFVRIVYLLWVEGKVLPLDQFSIDPSDEGLLFGRGVWESTRTIGGVPWLWAAHLDRLKQTAQYLNIDVAPERLPDSARVTEYVRALTADQDVLVRLNVTAGRPGKSGLVWMSASPQPYPAPSLRLRSCRSPVQKGQAYLTLKTFQYATRLWIGQQAQEAGFDTALLLDAEGNLQEAAHANIFVRLPDGWATPKADGGLLPGTVRQFLLNRGPVPMREEKIPYARLGEFQEVFVTNSNVGIVPITQIDERTLPIGSDTQQLMRALQPPPATGTQYGFVQRRTTPR